MTRAPRWTAIVLELLVFLVIGQGIAPAATAADRPVNAATPRPDALSGWTRIAHDTEPAVVADEGVATVRPAGAAAAEDYTGVATVPLDLLARGWNHIGDPDSAGGYVFDPVQTSGSDPADAHAKLFRVTTPDGRDYDYVHRLASGEAANNSWAAVSADRQWMLSGEFGTMTRFLMFPTPLLNPATPRAGGPLGLAATVALDRPVRDVQGCDFGTATRLLCTAEDTRLLQVDLAAAPSGADLRAHVTVLGRLPLTSLCLGRFEAEGIDYDASTGDVRVIVNPPVLCSYAVTDVYTFREK